MNLKGTGSVRATLLAKLWLTATCWQSKLTSALGFSGASWEGMQSCIDFIAGFSQTILFEPGWHWECCCPTVTMKQSGQVSVYHHRTEQRRPPVPNCFHYLFRKHLFSGAVHTDQYVLLLCCVSSYPLIPLEPGLTEWPSVCCVVPCMCNVLDKYCHWHWSIC